MKITEFLNLSVSDAYRATVRSMSRWAQRIGCMRPIAVVTLSCFIVTGVFGQVLASIADDRQTLEQFRQMVGPATIPTTLGRITAAANLGSREVIINIQDLHCSPEVQKNISQIIELLNAKGRVSTIYQEGAWGTVNVSWADAITDGKLRTKVVEGLLSQGELTGAEYYCLQKGKKGLITGIEDKKIYTTNVARLDAVMESKEAIEQVIGKMELGVEQIVPVYTGVRNRRLEDKIREYKSGTIDSRKFYRFVQKQGEKSGIDVASYQNITAFLAMGEQVRSLNYSQISVELQKFVGLLKKTLPYNAYKTLEESTDNFSKVDELYASLARISGKYNLNLTANYPQLARFFEYLEKNQRVNPLTLVREEKKLVRDIKTALAERDSEKDIVFLADFMGVYRDYFTTKISMDDYTYFTQNIDRFNHLWAKYRSRADLARLAPYAATLHDYYAANQERTMVFLRNSIGDRPVVASAAPHAGPQGMEMIAGAERVVVMVSGGFHTQGFTELLRARNVSYVTITPNVTTDLAPATKAYNTLIHEQAVLAAQALGPLVIGEKPTDVIAQKVAGVAIADLVYRQKMPIVDIIRLVTEVIENLGVQSPTIAIEVSGDEFTFTITVPGRVMVLRCGKTGAITNASVTIGAQTTTLRSASRAARFAQTIAGTAWYTRIAGWYRSVINAFTPAARRLVNEDAVLSITKLAGNVFDSGKAGRTFIEGIFTNPAQRRGAVWVISGTNKEFTELQGFFTAARITQSFTYYDDNGNIVMYFPPETGKKALSDLRKLLKDRTPHEVDLGRHSRGLKIAFENGAEYLKSVMKEAIGDMAEVDSGGAVAEACKEAFMKIRKISPEAWGQDQWMFQLRTAVRMTVGHYVLLATGGGKTFVVITAWAKLLHDSKAKRILDEKNNSPETKRRGVMVWTANYKLAERDAITASQAVANMPNARELLGARTISGINGIPIGFLRKGSDGKDASTVFVDGVVHEFGKDVDVRAWIYDNCDVIYTKAEQSVWDAETEAQAKFRADRHQMNRQWFVLADEAHTVLDLQGANQYTRTSGRELPNARMSLEAQREAAALAEELFLGEKLYTDDSEKQEFVLTRAGNARSKERFKKFNAARKEAVNATPEQWTTLIERFIGNPNAVPQNLIERLAATAAKDERAIDELIKKENARVVAAAREAQQESYALKQLNTQELRKQFLAEAQKYLQSELSDLAWAGLVKTAMSACNLDTVLGKQEVDKRINAGKLKAFRREGRDYAITEDADKKKKISIIQESTGDLGANQRWGNDLHAAVEIANGIVPEVEKYTSSGMMMQQYLGLEHIIGFGAVSGTFDRDVIQEVYNKEVIVEGLQDPLTERPLTNAEVKSRARPMVVGRYIDTTKKEKDVRVLATIGTILSTLKKSSLLVKVESPAAAAEMKEKLIAQGIPEDKIEVVNALNADLSVLDKLGKTPGTIAIVTNLAAIGVDIQLDDIVESIVALSTYADGSQLEEFQFRTRAGRSGAVGYYISMWSLEDHIFLNNPEMGLEAQAVIRGLKPTDSNPTAVKVKLTEI
ncbi:MAG: hypothetical protein WCG51_02265, partial [Elusimicrobiota bacterium]